MKNGNVMGFRGYRFFSPKSSKAKYKTLGTSEANFGGKKPRIILREVRYTMQPSVIPCHRIYNSKQFIPNINPIYRKNSNIMQKDPTRIMK